ncbi:extracellular solute-binding protein family 5 [Segniliparus rotundus DSM 44985]|uniref:Extracellular solute-binding protein family 5 n=1 Tax=Segniliparus rotundus (strain ATCC BAA-972 / CDC 1076 / CIP 108378 / DSM 44985 / JCM 13578) TaxID=640132 RepID=D6Z7I8_SEGRD|nr:ABC transporter substrate-binding protein [Segniliparus rotundus]ADG97918.1 extracellular solute-binding protein family 5 [Segniliparus rotundus DSM 44985]
MRLSRPAARIATALAVLLCCATGCGFFHKQAEVVNYFIDAKLPTYNANTALGRSSGALMAFARVLPGFSYPSPTGSSVADADVGSAEPLAGQGEEFTVRYTFNPKAVWSDGVPMTCDDLVLAWAALAGRLPGAVPASKAGYELITNMQCAAGSKTATAVFERHFPGWSGLFGPGTILPSHVLAKAARLRVVDAVSSADQARLQAAGKFWNSGWDFTGKFDAAKFPASGPYRIQSADAGRATLVRNERWWGESARTPKVEIWPKGFRPPVAGAQVIDIGKGSIAQLALPSGLREKTVRSLGIEQFVLSLRGTFAAKRAREAFALCLPRASLAAQFGDAGAPAAGELSSSQDPWQLSPAQPARYVQPDAAAAYRAREEVSKGKPITVRVGYLAPDARRAALVAAVAQSCDPAGVRVLDSSKDFNLLALESGQLDVLLTSSDLATGAGGAAGPTWDLTAAAQVRTEEGENVSGYASSQLDDLILRLALTEKEDERIVLLAQAQEAIWEDLPVIPLFAQPRSLWWSEDLRGVVPNATASGAGWNMERWSADD